MNKILKSFGMALLMAALLVGTGAAQTTVTGQLTTSCSLVVPGDVGTWPLTVGGTNRIDAPIGSGISNSVEVSCNSPYGVTVEVLETSGDGKMSSTGDTMTDGLTVDGTNNGANTDVADTEGGYATDYSSVVLSSSGQPIFDVDDSEDQYAAGTYGFDIDFYQQVIAADSAGTYSIVVTFTATAKES